MKRKIKSWLKSPIILLLFAMLIIFTPQAIYSPGQSRNIGVVVALGIDKVDDEFEVSLLTFIPKPNQTFKEVDSVVSGKAENIAQALYNAQVALGRRVGLSHVKTTVLSEKLMQEDVTSVVDYLTRLAALSASTVFVGTNTSAKEILTLSSKLEDGIGLDLEQVIGFNSDKLFASETSLEEFYQGYYGRSGASIIAYLPVVEGEKNAQASVLAEGESAGGASISENPSQQGEEGSKGGEEKNKYILNTGQSILLKKGRMVDKLTLKQMDSINLINPKTAGEIVRVKDVNINGEEHDLTYRVREKNVKTRTKFENGIPVFYANVQLGMELMEINGNHNNVKVRSEYSKLTPEIIAKIDARLRADFADALDILRGHDVDVLGICDAFFRENRQKYMTFVKGLEGEDKFLDEVIIKLNFEIEPN